MIKDFPEIKEYRLKYQFGAWVTRSVLFAETDEEAIFDADACEKPALDKLPYALFCGNRLVKKYNSITH